MRAIKARFERRGWQKFAVQVRVTKHCFRLQPTALKGQELQNACYNNLFMDRTIVPQNPILSTMKMSIQPNTSWNQMPYIVPWKIRNDFLFVSGCLCLFHIIVFLVSSKWKSTQRNVNVFCFFVAKFLALNHVPSSFWSIKLRLNCRTHLLASLPRVNEGRFSASGLGTSELQANLLQHIWSFSITALSHSLLPPLSL